jgi:hypothetical protein
MAKVIEFYVPSIFRKTLKGASRKRCGKAIEFCRQTRKSDQEPTHNLVPTCPDKERVPAEGVRSL